MPIVYGIKDWDKHFENSESRKIKSLTWLPVKNKHDGKGYRRVCQHPKSIQVFCAWNLMIQVASKMPVRGLLRDDDGPLTASDLSDKTGYPPHIFEAAFQLLTDPKIGWLTSTHCPAVPPSPDTSGHVGTEWNGMEWNGMEQPPEPIKPTIKAVLGDSQGGQPAPATPVGNGVQAGGLLTEASLVRVANDLLNGPRAGEWFTDNSRVTREMFTLNSLITVLRGNASHPGYLGRVREAAVRPAFARAVTDTHAKCVDFEHRDPIRKPGAECVTRFRELLAQGVVSP